MRTGIQLSVIAVSTALAGTSAARAQITPSVGVVAGASQFPLGGWQSSSIVNSSIRADAAPGWLNASLGLATMPTSARLNTASAEGALFAPDWNGFRLGVDANANRTLLPYGSPISVGAAEATLSFRHSTSGAWVGFGSAVTTGNDSMPHAPLMSAGFWHQFSDVILSISANTRVARFGGSPSGTHYVRAFGTHGIEGSDSSLVESADTGYMIMVTDSGSPSHTRAWTETEAHLGWSRGRVALDAILGARPPMASVTGAIWAQGAATIQMADRVALVAGAGTIEQRIDIGTPASRYMTLGLRIAPPSFLRPPMPAPVRPSTQSFTLRRTPDGQYIISLHVPHARIVELSGDFDHWVPVTLAEASPDVWEGTLAVAPGTYRMNIRVDGDAWIAPPGVVTVDDEFNGTVGIVVIR